MYVCSILHTVNLVSQNSSSEVSDHNKKILTTSFGGGIGSGDHLSSSLDRHLSKDKSEVIGMYLTPLLKRLMYVLFRKQCC